MDKTGRGESLMHLTDENAVWLVQSSRQIWLDYDQVGSCKPY